MGLKIKRRICWCYCKLQRKVEEGCELREEGCLRWRERRENVSMVRKSNSSGKENSLSVGCVFVRERRL